MYDGPRTALLRCDWTSCVLLLHLLVWWFIGDRATGQEITIPSGISYPGNHLNFLLDAYDDGADAWLIALQHQFIRLSRSPVPTRTRKSMSDRRTSVLNCVPQIDPFQSKTTNSKLVAEYCTGRSQHKRDEHSTRSSIHSTSRRLITHGT